MPHYFAYGSNMDRGAMNARCPLSVPLGTASLAGFRFFITRDGYASIRPEPGSVVYGLVWQLDPRDEINLDRYEEVAEGLYTKATAVVRLAGLDQRALIYRGRDDVAGVARPGYMESVLAAADACGLPDAHRSELRRWLPASLST